MGKDSLADWLVGSQDSESQDVNLHHLRSSLECKIFPLPSPEMVKKFWGGSQLLCNPHQVIQPPIASWGLNPGSEIPNLPSFPLQNLEAVFPIRQDGRIR